MVRKVILTLICICVTLIFRPAWAQEQAKPSSGDKTINVSIHPTISAMQKKYEEAIKTLTPEQAGFLKKLDEENIKANEPQFAIISQRARFAACAKKDPSLLSTHGEMSRTFRFRMLDELAIKRKEFQTLKGKADFIDPDALEGHLQFDSELQKQLMSGMAQILEHTGLEDEACAELKAELEKSYNTPYAVLSKDAIPRADILRDGTTGRINSCGMSFRYAAPDGNTISVPLLVMDVDEGIKFDFNTKIHDPNGKYLPVADLWIDFDSYSTRFRARHTEPDKEIMIGNLPLQDILPVLKAMADQKDVVISARLTGRSDAYVFRVLPPAPEEVKKMADCAASLEPRLTEPLQKVGFSIAPDEKHGQALASGKSSRDFLYKVMRLKEDQDNPGGCVWNISPYRNESMEMGLMFFITGFIAPDVPLNYSTTLWLIGMKDGARYSFKDAHVTTRNADTGETIDTRDLQKKSMPGQRYEIHMPFSAGSGILHGVIKNGLSAEAAVEGESAPIAFSFPPPEPESVKAYLDCIAVLRDDIVKRRKSGNEQAAPGTAGKAD